MSVDAFIAALHALPPLPGVFNPWRDCDLTYDATPEAPAIRSAHLRQYLEERVATCRVVLVGEAPGYQGARFSGMAMTSERILLGAKDGVDHEHVFHGEKRRTSRPELWAEGANEPTATIVWGLWHAMGQDPRSLVLWNTFPVHPYKPGEPLSNRTPKPGELAAAAHVLPALLRLLPQAAPVAVGRIAQRRLHELGYMDIPCVRHPAMGGATEFRAQMTAWLATR